MPTNSQGEEEILVPDESSDEETGSGGESPKRKHKQSVKATKIRRKRSEDVGSAMSEGINRGLLESAKVMAQGFSNSNASAARTEEEKAIDIGNKEAYLMKKYVEMLNSMAETADATEIRRALQQKIMNLLEKNPTT